MGLLVEIYKNPAYAACSNGGVSSKADGACVVNAEGPFNPSDKYPAVIVDSHVDGCVRAIPAEYVAGKWVKAQGWYVAGGAYIASSDGRFNALVTKLTGAPFYGAVSLHDRKEA